MKSLRPFHLAIPVDCLDKARNFYGSKLGFEEGRSDDHWIDYNFFGHQLVCHIGELNKSNNNEVDGKDVPIPHFGIILEWDDFDSFSSKLFVSARPDQLRERSSEGFNDRLAT